MPPEITSQFLESFTYGFFEGLFFVSLMLLPLFIYLLSRPRVFDYPKSIHSTEAFSYMKTVIQSCSTFEELIVVSGWVKRINKKQELFDDKEMELLDKAIAKKEVDIRQELTKIIGYPLGKLQ